MKECTGIDKLAVEIGSADIETTKTTLYTTDATDTEVNKAPAALKIKNA